MFPRLPDELAEDMGMDRRTVVMILVALGVVLGMGLLILTWTTLSHAEEDFRGDCVALGGTVHELGDQTLCMVDQHVVGRRG
jgi:hypothetical protein